MIKKLNIYLKKKKMIYFKKNKNELKIFLLPKDDDDNKNAIVEIRAELEVSKPLFVQIYLKCMKKFAPKNGN